MKLVVFFLTELRFKLQIITDSSNMTQGLITIMKHLIKLKLNLESTYTIKQRTYFALKIKNSVTLVLETPT